MYGYVYSYSYGKIGGEIDLSLYKFTTWQPTTNIDGTREIVNEGSANNMTLYGGQGTYFNGTNQLLTGFTIPAGATNMYYWKDGIFYDTTTLIDFGVIVPVGWYKDVYYYTRALTETERIKMYEQPEQFFIDAKNDATCVLNMPMTDADWHARDYSSYSEVLILNDDTDVSLPPSNNVKIYYNYINTHNIYYFIKITDLIGTVSIKCGSNAYFRYEEGGVVIFADNTSEGRIIVRALVDNVTYSAIEAKQLSGIYPMENATNDTKDLAKNLQYGLQTPKLVTDSLGVIQSVSPWFECNGTSTGTIAQHNEIVDVDITVNPSSLDGDVLSGGLTLSASGLTLNQDNNITLTNQTIASDIILGDGFKGTIKLYEEREV